MALDRLCVAATWAWPRSPSFSQLGSMAPRKGKAHLPHAEQLDLLRARVTTAP